MSGANDGRRFADAAGGAVFGNGFRPTGPWFSSTGLRTFAVRHAAGSARGSARPAEDFLINSRLRRRDVEFEASVGAYFTEPAALMTALLGLEGRQGTESIALPAPVPLHMALSEAIQRRRSARAYTGDAISLRYVSSLLAAAGGVTRRLTGDYGRAPALRSVPSGGALYPVGVLVVTLCVDGLARGVYSYDPRGEVLWRTGADEAVDLVLAAAAGPDERAAMQDAAAIFLLVARPWRAMRKYGDRGMRHVFIETGLMAAHLHLAGAALGVGSRDTASLYDDEVHEALELDGVYEALVHAIVVGVAA